MALEECKKCGAYKIEGSCWKCNPPSAEDRALFYYLRQENPKSGLAHRPVKVNVKPVEPLRHASELAPFSSRGSIRTAGDVVTTVNQISSHTTLGVAWMNTRGPKTQLYIAQEVRVRGLIFERTARAELLIEER